jgi:flagellar protein FlaG
MIIDVVTANLYNLPSTEVKFYNSSQVNNKINIDVSEALKNTINVARTFNRQIHFSFHKELGKMIVKIVDSQNNKVIRQMPSDELVELAIKAKNFKGLLLNKEV